MKKRQFPLIAAALLVLLSLYAYAGFLPVTEDSVADDEFVIATFHSVKKFTADDDKIVELEESFRWLAANRTLLNLKYTGILGEVTVGSVADYNQYSSQGVDAFVQVCLQEENWRREFERAENASSILTRAAIPFGVSAGFSDYPGDGMKRANLVGGYFNAANLFPQNTMYRFYDECNYYYCFTAGDTDYMILTLELWPRKAVLDWVNTLLPAHPDKRVIVLTSSLLYPDGTLFKMWDWQVMIDNNLTPAEFWTEAYMKAPYVTTDITRGNFTWEGNPRDGDHLWSYSLEKHDNIFLIVNSYIDRTYPDYHGQIVGNTFVNDGGYEVAAVLANTEPLAAEQGALPLLIKIKNDASAVDVRYASSDTDGVSFSLNVKEVAPSEGNLAQAKLRKQSIGTNQAYIQGYEDLTFRPQNNMTRAEACAIIARLLGYESFSHGALKTAFADVAEEEWYYGYIAYLEGFRILRGYGALYEPSRPITRAEFVEMLYLADGFDPGQKEVFFYDVDSFGSFYDAIFAASGAGVINGYEDETFRPDHTITRAEVVTIINRTLGISGTAEMLEGGDYPAFGDIAGHWAYGNIVIASNSGVVPSYCKGIDTAGITENADSITLENGNVRMVLSKKDGKVTEFYDKRGGTAVLSNYASPYFCYFFAYGSGNKSYPLELKMDHNRLCFVFENGVQVYLIAQIYDQYMTFEVDSYGYPSFYGFAFANLQFSYSLAGEASFAVCSLAMTDNVNPEYDPDGKAKKVIGNTYGELGINGAKLAVVAAPLGEHREILKRIADTIPKGQAPVSKGVGGPYALDYPANTGDYVIISTSDKSLINAWLPMYLEYDVDMLDFHQGSRTFRQGDFYFHLYGSAANFKKEIADPLHEAGISLGLQSYAFYIDPGASGLLSDPKWQRDLLIGERYTLAEDIGKFTTTLPTEESTAEAYTLTGFRALVTEYMLIDEEIVKINTAAIGSKSFSSVSRGQCGTKVAEHPAGARMKRIAGYYNGLTPIMGSDLFYEVARQTARAYNEGGFDMIYLDAIDGITKHAPYEYYWYYLSAFVTEILEYCDKPPIIETLRTWLPQGRANTWDHPTRAYKVFNRIHSNDNQKYIEAYLPAMIGWYDLYPIDSSTSLGNWQFKYQFFDDVDYLGMLALVYDYGMVYNGLTLEKLNSTPALRRNMERYSLYSTLRKTNYFSEAVRQKVKNSAYECAVTEKADGSYAFFEKYYAVDKTRNAYLTGMDSVRGENPFAAQEPFLRIEGAYSSKGDDPITILPLDETKPLNGQTISKTYSYLDAGGRYAVRVRVLGNNSSDALCVSLSGLVTGDHNVCEYVIRLNYEGWREFIFVDTDNGEYEEINFSGRTANFYALYRGATDFSQISEVRILKSGNCDGVQVSDVELCRHTENPVTDPTVRIGNQSITFRCTLQSSEYIEYFPGSPALIYDKIGNVREVDAVTGALQIPAGSFEAFFTGQADGSVPLRARLTFGFTGSEIR